MKFLLALLLILQGLGIFSQDTLRVMHYNILMYGNNYGGCNQSNNNIDDKNGYLNKIVDFVKPDILTVNEIYKTPVIHDYLLTYALNVNGVDYYEMGDPPNHANSFIMNQIYYNAQKLSVVSNLAIENNYRDIDIFRLKYESPEASLFNDPIYLNCVVAHLKAGNSYENQVERSNETNKLMNYLNNSNATGNYLMMGDFNVYSASEPAFQNLLFHQNESIRFYDPINAIGAWNNNSFYAGVHTQSTHTDGNCASGGGLDDRFDFILVSDEILYGTEKIKYLSGSYEALGQDGEHFNKSLLDAPQNTTVPAGVLNALYGMSDHLPVVLNLIIGDNLGVSVIRQQNFRISFSNPVTDHLSLTIQSDIRVNLSIRVLNIQGQPLMETTYTGSETGHHSMNIRDLAKGIYFLVVTDQISGSFAARFVKL